MNGDDMKIAIFGANGPTGRLLTRQALAEGEDVTAITRHSDAFPELDGRLHVVAGDVHDEAAVDAAVAGHDAVVSVLGVPFGKEPVSVYSVGATNMLAAMERHGVKRLIVVSSSTMAPHPTPQGGIVFRKVMQPYVVNKLGRTVYDDMRRMEAIVRGSDLDWTVVRPSGLFGTGAVTDYQVAEEHILGRFTAREDLADCLLRQCGSREFVAKALAIATVDVQPSMLKLVWREGIRKQS
jgi:nucleoside-diphosphate-sugar epimerase